MFGFVLPHRWVIGMLSCSNDCWTHLWVLLWTRRTPSKPSVGRPLFVAIKENSELKTRLSFHFLFAPLETCSLWNCISWWQRILKGTWQNDRTSFNQNQWPHYSSIIFIFPSQCRSLFDGGESQAGLGRRMREAGTRIDLTEVSATQAGPGRNHPSSNYTISPKSVKIVCQFHDRTSGSRMNFGHKCTMTPKF